jgi:hypothetical protein
VIPFPVLMGFITIRRRLSDRVASDFATAPERRERALSAG